jgi:hypothetical protein
MHCMRLAHAVLMAIRKADASGCKETCQPTFGASPPVDPFAISLRPTSLQQRLEVDPRYICVAFRAVVLCGNGPAFCAGADLGWMKRMAEYEHARQRQIVCEAAEDGAADAEAIC